MRSIKKRINIVTFIVFICVFIFIYTLLLTPMKQKQEATIIENFELNVLNQQQVVNEFVSKMVSETKSLSSRSIIRDALIRYKNDEIDWTTLHNITLDKYQDGISVIDDFDYIARMVDNQVLVQFGDSTILSELQLQESNSTYVYYQPDQQMLVIQNPIIDQNVFLGYDILCVGLQPIFEKIQNNHENVWIETEISQNINFVQEGWVTVGKAFESFQGTFFVQTSEESLFLESQKMLSKILGLSTLAIIGIFLILDFVVIKYAKGIVREVEDSRTALLAREEETYQIIHEMNKGFILLDVIDQTGKETKRPFQYRFVNVNRTFEEITGMREDEILGKTLCDILAEQEQHWIYNLDHVVKEKTSLAFQVHMDFNDKWYRISAYRPKAYQVVMMMDDITENIHVQNQLARSEQQMRITLDVIGEGIWNWDMTKGIVDHNRKWSEIVGVDVMQMEHTTDAFFSFVHPKDQAIVRERLRKSIDNDQPYHSEHRIVREDGTTIWVLDRGALVYDDSSDGPVRMIGSILNVTYRKQTEEALSAEKEVFKTTLLSVGDGVIATDVYGNINFMNLEAEKLTGWDDEDAQGKPLESVYRLIDESSRELVENIIEHYVSLEESEQERQRILESVSGRHIPIQETIAPIQSVENGGTTGFVIAFRDVTEQRERQREIEELSFNDFLTGLYNRRYMEDSIRRLDTKRNLPLTIMALDINGLKMANDAFGHELGDELIQAAARVIKSACREEDIIARTGGDEFMVLLPKTSLENAEAIKQRIITAAKKERVQSIGVSIAIGYCVKRKEEDDIFEIQKQADKHMYKHKMKSSKKMKLSMVSMAMQNIQQNHAYEERHSERVSEYCGRIYQAMNYSQEDIDEIMVAGTLHDIGKIILPPELLNKKEKITQEEVDQLQRYPEAGYQILKNTDEYASIADEVLHHHERFDGTGYPGRLKGEEIPIGSRVIAVADAYEAMTGERPYKVKMSQKEAIEELKRCSGSQFDPHVVDVFIQKVLPKDAI